MTSAVRIPALTIVEDEVVRFSGVGIFADAGFRVIEAQTSDEALETLDADCDVKLLFTDVNRSGLIDGLALARMMQDRWPHSPASRSENA